MNPSVAVVSKFDRQGAERKRGYGVNASPLSEGCRFERAHPACCVPFDSAGLKTTEQFPFPVECRLVAEAADPGCLLSGRYRGESGRGADSPFRLRLTQLRHWPRPTVDALDAVSALSK